MRRYFSICIPLVLLCLTPSALPAGDDVQIQADVVYGRKDGMALTFDVLRPKNPNGAAVLHLQSGGWYSTWRDPKLMVNASKPLLAKGFTVFIVYHGSAPKYNLTEATADVRRCVRFIRLHAKDYGIDPERLGVTGASAGGHLSLMLGTTAEKGDAKSKDEVLRQSSRVAAVVAIFPPTDIRGWTTNPPEEIKKIPALKPPLTFDESLEAAHSPLLHVTKDDAPILLIHGDLDKLVPIEHSRNMIAALKKAAVVSDLVVIEGAAHGFNAKQNMIVVPALVDWFEKHLKK
jgi:dipeptidyl aminopeptidase/acylaminoacyl peptidase